MEIPEYIQKILDRQDCGPAEFDQVSAWITVHMTTPVEVHEITAAWLWANREAILQWAKTKEILTRQQEPT